MSKPLLLAAVLATMSAVAQAEVPAYVGQHDTHPKDVEAILEVATDFRAALVAKDGRKLSALFLNPNILFSSPSSAARLKKLREAGRPAKVLDANGAAEFVDFISTSKNAIEERFYNIKVTQDGHIAWMMFDFDFVEAGKVENYGIETWQLVKGEDDRWKILSVVWSSRGAPKPSNPPLPRAG